jgi:hypothetical protein
VGLLQNKLKTEYDCAAIFDFMNLCKHATIVDRLLKVI